MARRCDARPKKGAAEIPDSRIMIMMKFTGLTKTLLSFILGGLIMADAKICAAGDQVHISTGGSGGQSGMNDNEFYQQDRNGDGAISTIEWLGNTAEFYRMDENHDGMLTRYEYADRSQYTDAWQNGTRDAFSAMDADRNLVITPDEWTSDPNSFYRLDRNRDEALSHTEFFGASFTRENTRYSQPYQARSAQQEYEAMDTDHDGFIAHGEWKYDRASFDELDRNHNTELSRDEWTTTSQQESPQNDNQPLQTLLEGLFQKR